MSTQRSDELPGRDERKELGEAALKLVHGVGSSRQTDADAALNAAQNLIAASNAQALKFFLLMFFKLNEDRIVKAKAKQFQTLATAYADFCDLD